VCSYFQENNWLTLFHETINSEWDISSIVEPFCQDQTGDTKIHSHVTQDSVIAHMANQSMLALRGVFSSQMFSHWPSHVPHSYEIFKCG
jgi:hypothetical protein